MSRSRKKTPITGITTCCSEKEDKKLWHKKLRSRIRQEIHKLEAGVIDPEEYNTVLDREVVDVWDLGKDGKQWWSSEEDYRK